MADGDAKVKLFSRSELIDKFGYEEYAIFGLMLAVSAAIGVLFWWRGQKSNHEFLLGGRNMGTLPMTMSLVARWGQTAARHYTTFTPLLSPMFVCKFLRVVRPLPTPLCQFHVCHHAAGDACRDVRQWYPVRAAGALLPLRHGRHSGVVHTRVLSDGRHHQLRGCHVDVRTFSYWTLQCNFLLQYLEWRFDQWVRIAASLCFILQMVKSVPNSPKSVWSHPPLLPDLVHGHCRLHSGIGAVTKSVRIIITLNTHQTAKMNAIIAFPVTGFDVDWACGIIFFVCIFYTFIVSIARTQISVQSLRTCDVKSMNGVRGRRLGKVGLVQTLLFTHIVKSCNVHREASSATVICGSHGQLADDTNSHNWLLPLLQGGIKAVMWTDTFQTVMMFGSFLAVIIKGNYDAGGASVIFDENYKSGRIELFKWGFLFCHEIIIVCQHHCSLQLRPEDDHPPHRLGCDHWRLLYVDLRLWHQPDPGAALPHSQQDEAGTEVCKPTCRKLAWIMVKIRSELFGGTCWASAPCSSCVPTPASSSSPTTTWLGATPLRPRWVHKHSTWRTFRVLIF